MWCMGKWCMSCKLDIATNDLNIRKIIFLSSIQEIFQVWGQQLKNLSVLLWTNFLYGALLPLSGSFIKILQMLFGLLDYYSALSTTF